MLVIESSRLDYEHHFIEPEIRRFYGMRAERCRSLNSPYDDESIAGCVVLRILDQQQDTFRQ